MDRKENPMESLIAKFNRAGDFEAKPVFGFIEECSILEEAGKKIYVVHIRNGGMCNAFWLAHDYDNPSCVPPRRGDQVKGIINTFDDSVSFADLTYKPIFDFENLSADSECAAFAWFRQQEFLASINSPAVSPIYKKPKP